MILLFAVVLELVPSKITGRRITAPRSLSSMRKMLARITPPYFDQGGAAFAAGGADAAGMEEPSTAR